MVIANTSYFTALGKFIHCFSAAETAIHYVFHVFAKVTPEVANAIKRDCKASEVATMIRSLLIVNEFDPEVTSDMGECLTQFSVISEFRNSTIHRGASETEDGSFRSTNVMTMKSLEGLEITTFSLDHLAHATNDLARLTMRIIEFADGTRVQRSPSRTKLLYAPWRYRSVQQDKPHQPPRKAKPESRRLQKASRKKAAEQAVARRQAK